MTNCIPTELTRRSGWEFYLSDYKLLDEKRREALFALGNGVLTSRAATLESRIGEYHYPGTYRAGCYELLHSPIAGQVDVTESLANLPNWLSLTVRMHEGRPVSLDSADLLAYRHGLDIHKGIAWREWTLRDDANCLTKMREERLMSMDKPSIGAVRLQVTPLNWSGLVEITSALDGAVINANVQRYLDYELHHVQVVAAEILGEGELALRAKTRNSNTHIDFAVRTCISGAETEHLSTTESAMSVAEKTAARACRGVSLTVDKLAVISSPAANATQNSQRNWREALQSLSDYSDLRRAHLAAWAQLWQKAAIESEHEDVSLTLRFHAFHLLQTVSPHSEQRDTGVPARGWHGEVYRGQIFWDELFVLPFYNCRFPAIARSVLLYRYRRLPQARLAAQEGGFRGAMFPWRSALSGKEVTPAHQKNLITGGWTKDPTHLQHHVGSAIAFNIWRYYLTSGDYEFLQQFGAEMLFEIARFWASIAQYNRVTGRYDIDGVIGPDEYHNQYPNAPQPGLKNNAYTNVMAAWTLCRALDLREVLGRSDLLKLTHKLDLRAEEFRNWDAISRKLQVCFADDVISQFDGFDKLLPFDAEQLPEQYRNARVDWALQAQGESADHYQVTKQADTLTLFYLLSEREIAELFQRLGYRYSRDLLQRTARYYLSRSSHRSSLSQVVYAGALAYAQPEVSWQLFRRALATDLRGLDGESTAEGIHLGAMGGTLDIIQRCYGGLSPVLEGLRVQPNVPPELGRLQFELVFRGQKLGVVISPRGVTLNSPADNEREITLISPEGAIELHAGEKYFVANQVDVPLGESH